MADTFSTRCVHLHILSHGSLDCYDTIGIEIVEAQISSTHNERKLIRRNYKLEQKSRFRDVRAVWKT